jgi:hypothetical protein
MNPTCAVDVTGQLVGCLRNAAYLFKNTFGCRLSLDRSIAAALWLRIGIAQVQQDFTSGVSRQIYPIIFPAPASWKASSTIALFSGSGYLPCRRLVGLFLAQFQLETPGYQAWHSLTPAPSDISGGGRRIQV